MIIYVLLFFGGLFLSAFFSGSETGFYRVTRLRLVLDASEGSRVARGLLLMTNNPGLFVATTLVGNNVANYLTSLAIVLAARELAGDVKWVELAAPLAMTPVVFVYGELLPKNLFYQAPNMLLRRGGPLFMLFALLFAPVSGLLWLLGRVLEGLLGQTPLKLQSQLARHELQQALDEGGEAGILRPAQRRLSQSLFDVAALSVQRLAVPLAKAPKVSAAVPASVALQQAAAAGVASLVVSDNGKPAGYVRVIDLRLGKDSAPVREHLRPLPRVKSTSTHLAALIALRTADADVAQVTDEQQRSVAIVYGRDLVEELLNVK